MTARELAMLARHIITTYPDYYQLFSQREFHYRKHKFFNRNPLLGLVAGVDGLKTGHIKEAGYGMVASAKQDNRRLIVVVNGLATGGGAPGRGAPAARVGLPSFSEAKLYDAGEVVGHARVWGGTRMYVPLVGKGDVNVWLPRNPANQKLRAHIVYQWPLKPPLKKGDQVAMLRVTTAAEAMSEVPLYVAEDVEPGGHDAARARLAPLLGNPLAAVTATREGRRSGPRRRRGQRRHGHRASSSPSRAARAPASPRRRICWPIGCAAGHRRGRADARAWRLALRRAGARPDARSGDAIASAPVGGAAVLRGARRSSRTRSSGRRWRRGVG